MENLIEEKEPNASQEMEPKKQEKELSKQEMQDKTERIDEIKKKIMILEWDKEKNQLNPGKHTYLKKLKEELNSLKED